MANSEAALASETGLLHPKSPWDLGPPNSQIAGVEFLAQQPGLPCALIMGLIRQQSTIHSLHLVAGNQPQPELQCLLNKSWGFVGLRQAVAGLGVT